MSGANLRAVLAAENAETEELNMPKTFYCADPAKLCSCSGFEQCAECSADVLDADFDVIGERPWRELSSEVQHAVLAACWRDA